MELAPGAKDQDSAVFLMFFDVFFFVLGFHQNSLGEHPQNMPPDQNDRLT